MVCRTTAEICSNYRCRLRSKRVGVKDRDQYLGLHRFAVTERDLFRTVPMIPGARRVLRRLSDEGYRIIRIITHRVYVHFFSRYRRPPKFALIHPQSSAGVASRQHPTLLNGFLSNVAVTIVPVALTTWRAATPCAVVHSASLLPLTSGEMHRFPARAGSLAQRQASQRGRVTSAAAR
jgi:predicted nuclease with RNAse H fold